MIPLQEYSHMLYAVVQVWLINAMKMKVVDTTSSIRAVHQVIEGLSEDENSHKTHKQEAGMLYNEDLAKELR